MKVCKFFPKIAVIFAAATMLCSCGLIGDIWRESPITITLTSKKYGWDNFVWTDYQYNVDSGSYTGVYINNDRAVCKIDREFFLPDNMQVNLLIKVFTDKTTTLNFCELNTKYTTEEIVEVGGEDMNRVFVDIDLYDLETGELDKLETQTTGWVEFSSCPPNGICGEFSFSVLDGDELILKIDGKFDD